MRPSTIQTKVSRWTKKHKQLLDLKAEIPDCATAYLFNANTESILVEGYGLGTLVQMVLIATTQRKYMSSV